MGTASKPEDESREVLDVAGVRRWAVLTRVALAARRAEIDALNVFPVPDGDTGSNLYLTYDAALDRLAGDPVEEPGTVGALLTAFSGHLLWSARGNSGVITSQLSRGLAEGIDGAVTVDGPTLVAGLVQADRRAWQAVTEPVEGTILSVSRAAAEAATRALDLASGVVSAHAVIRAATLASRTALARTTEQLPALTRAGVVDAGGAGLVLILDCLERVLAGNDGRVLLRPRQVPRQTPAAVAAPAVAGAAPAQEGPTPEFEVMYLLTAEDEAGVDGLRARLVDLGDSVLVVGGERGLWNVHAHVDDAGAAVEAGLGVGPVQRIRITSLRSGGGPEPCSDPDGGDDRSPEHDDRAERDAPGAPSDSGRGVGPDGDPVPGWTGLVACVAGAGFAQLFHEVGASVVPSSPGARASTGQIVTAIRAQRQAGAASVVVLPNDSDAMLAAESAVRTVLGDGTDAVVVRARTAVQGVAALAVYEPSLPLAANVQEMQAAASATRHGAVTISDRDGLTTAGPCRVGDPLGIVDGDIAVVGQDEVEVAREVTRRLLTSGGELVTVLLGVVVPDGLVEAVEAEVRTHIGVELAVIDGGQNVYSALIGVE